jgi:sugar/nucleoside kinase (ribokinase family)
MDLADAEAIHAQVSAGTEQSGGSVANAMAGLAALGSRVGFIGRIARDRLGRTFADDIEALGVTLAASEAEEGSTGRCLILVTPDADRTMCTSLGVSAGLDVNDIDGDLISRGAVTYLEGYLFDLPAAKAAYRQAISVAHSAGRLVALTLSDPFCVSRHRADFAALVEAEVDVLFGNAEEVCTLTGADDVTEACRRLRRPGLMVTVTLGSQGALAFESSEEQVLLPAEPVPLVVDTTGAGDLYAAGFLCGLTRGKALDACVRLGAVAAAEIISHFGARPEADLSVLAEPILG